MTLPLIYRTTTMLAAISQFPKVTNFLRDRYFPTDPTRDIFTTEDVLMDIREGAARMAPVVLPRKKGIVVARDAYRTERMTPPLVAPERTLTLDDLESRGFGEALFSEMSAEEREAAILAQDLQDMADMISNREEYIAAQCMLNNGYILPQYADGHGSNEAIPYEIRFYAEPANPSSFTPAIPWDQSGADVYGDMGIMVRMLTQKGKPVSDFIGSPDVMDQVIDDDRIYKMLDNKNMQFGSLTSEALPEGASFYGYINVAGRRIGLYSYEARFIDDQTGDDLPLFAPGQAVMTAPAAGRGLYGAIKQIDIADNKFHTYSGTRVPKYTVAVDADTRTLRVANRPLLTPRYVNPWVSADLFA